MSFTISSSSNKLRRTYVICVYSHSRCVHFLYTTSFNPLCTFIAKLEHLPKPLQLKRSCKLWMKSMLHICKEKTWKLQHTSRALNTASMRIKNHKQGVRVTGRTVVSVNNSSAKFFPNIIANLRIDSQWNYLNVLLRLNMKKSPTCANLHISSTLRPKPHEDFC